MKNHVASGHRSSCAIESLERRQLLAAPVLLPESPLVTTVSGRGTLTITGTAGRDTISVKRTGGSYTITADGYKPIVVSRIGVKRISVEALGGNDRVGIDANVTVPCTLVGGAGHDVLNGNPGDTLIGGAGNDKLVVRQVNPIRTGDSLAHPSDPRGPALLSGGTGNDTLFAGGNDTVIGGGGNDVAIYHRFTLDAQPLSASAGESIARTLYGPRTSGAERFLLLNDVIGGLTTLVG